MAQVKNQQTLLRPPLFSRSFEAISQFTRLSERTATHVMRLSNHYVAKPDSESPWLDPTALEALLLYFHPLNQSRTYGVSLRAKQVGFFSQLDRIVEVGAGSGAATLGIASAYAGFEFVTLTDISQEVLSIGRGLLEKCLHGLHSLDVQKLDLHRLKLKDDEAKSTLAVFSYVLTEGISSTHLEDFLKQNPSLEALAIFEPATQEDGRKLQAMRTLLQRYGYHIWAPCPHGEECPLLKQSERDWCHDRVPHIQPDWWEELESKLPIKNKSLTVSYLFARKQTPERGVNARVVGDPLFEKTKIRQMICRGENREFLSWFPSRMGIKPEEFDLARGDLFKTTELIFSDPRGTDRAREFRLTLDGINQIKTSLQTFPINSSSS